MDDPSVQGPQSVTAYVSGKEVFLIEDDRTKGSIPFEPLEGKSTFSAGKIYIQGVTGQFVRYAPSDCGFGGLRKVPWKKVEGTRQIASQPQATVDPPVEIKTNVSWPPNNRTVKGFAREGGSKTDTKKKDHEKKHGVEFGGEDYFLKARAFGNAATVGAKTAQIAHTFIKYDPKTGEVMVTHDQEMRTYYTWDQKFSDPFAYAICLTLLKMKKTLDDVDANRVASLKSEGIDLAAMFSEIAQKGEHS